MAPRGPAGGNRVHDVTSAHPALTGGPVYLDYNATTPVDPRVVEAMLPYLTEHFGNPSSDHAYATPARAALARARGQVAALLGTAGDRIVFAGSGSEANNLALHGAVLASGVDRPHLITQSTEHPAVLNTCRALARLHGVDVTILPVDSDGLVDPGDLATAITPRTVLVTIMLANNETGVLQPITELTRIAHDHGVLFHTDAAQAAGKVPLDVTALDVDLLTVVGHKMYAPKGIAALYVRAGVALEPIIYGGGQEHGLRAGTENIAFAVALGTAAGLATDDLAAGRDHGLRALRDRLHQGIADALPGRVQLNGAADPRLPNTLNISITGTRGDALLAAAAGLAASTGSACHAGTTEPSPVLTAMGVGRQRALSAVRLSAGRWTTDDDIDGAISFLAKAVD